MLCDLVFFHIDGHKKTTQNFHCALCVFVCMVVRVQGGRTAYADIIVIVSTNLLTISSEYLHRDMDAQY